jgi:hypothetical protein
MTFDASTCSITNQARLALSLLTVLIMAHCEHVSMPSDAREQSYIPKDDIDDDIHIVIGIARQLSVLCQAHHTHAVCLRAME